MKIDPSAPVSMTPRALILSNFASLESFSLPFDRHFRLALAAKIQKIYKKEGLH
jgi:hypothetical protein